MDFGKQLKVDEKEKHLVKVEMKIGKEDKAYDYLVKSITPMDKRLNNFIKDLDALGKEKAYDEAENVKKITPFYSYLFEVMKPYDSTYANEKEAEITRKLMEATK